MAIIMSGLIGPIVYVAPMETGSPESPPSAEYPLGTDYLGRNILSELFFAIRTSVSVGVISGVIAIIIAVVVGSISGIKVGMAGEALLFGINVMQTIPSILLAMLISVFFVERSYMLIALVIGITSWPPMARDVRGQIMTLKTREFAYMSRMAFMSDIKIALTDLIPNMASFIFLGFASVIGGAMMAEAGLSMLGVGVTKGTSLGVMLYWAQLQESVRRGMYWCFIPPGIVLVGITSSLVLVITALDEYFNPRLKLH
jgi:peptide/nickel transport system permease protein